MNDLLARAIAAHGGLERWNTFNKVSATRVCARSNNLFSSWRATMTR